MTFADIAWLICGVYATIPAFWLVVHPFAERWRRARYKFKALAPLWMSMWLVAWAVSFPWRTHIVALPAWRWLVAALFWCGTAWAYINGFRSFSTNRLIGRHEIDPKSEGSLVTTGVHGVVRHPVYLGHLCTMLGLTTASASVACAGLTAFAVFTGVIMIRLEDRELRARFGKDYDEYAARVPAIVPRVFR